MAKESSSAAEGRGRAALGARVHSGWAVVVAVAGPLARPVVIARRRIEIADPKVRGSRQPYHAAEGWPLDQAEEYLSQCKERTQQLADAAVSAMAAELRGRGYGVRGCGLLTASERTLPGLAGILASHALVHAAEGRSYREAVAAAAERSGLAVMRVRERELLEQAKGALRTTEEKLQAWAAAAGRTLGPPWTQDEKRAALAARIALAARRRSAAAR